MNRSDLGKDVESRARWDLGVYLSEIGKLDAKPSTKQRNKYDLNPKNKDGLDSKWQHAGNTQVDDGTGKGTVLRACVKAGKKSANTLVDDGSGKGTKVARAGVKFGNMRVDDGSGNGTMVRPCHKQASCITCNVARRQNGSDKCSPCALAVMAAFFGT
jgi:hypothetical protein